MTTSQAVKKIFFITGASGVGKTTLLNGLAKKFAGQPWLFLHFDSMGVPSLAEMEKEFSSPAAWQEAKAYEWIGKMVNEFCEEKIFLEGQVSLQFIRKGFEKYGFENYRILLVTCHETAMEQRLRQRGQPELFTNDMKNWLKYLENQAVELGTDILDTGTLKEDEVIEAFENMMQISDRAAS